MPDALQTPETTERPVATTAPVAHMTRRERIEAERIAAGHRPRRPAVARVASAPAVAAAPVSPIDSAPVSPDVAVPVSPVDSAPVSPDVAVPVSPVDAAPVSPDVAVPVSPVDAAPVSPGVAVPVSPVNAAPVSPDVAVPVSPMDAAPVSPDVAEPLTAKPVVAAPRSTPHGGVRRRGAPATSRPARVDRATRHLGAGPRRTTTSTPAGGASFRRAASRVTAVSALLFAAGLVVSTSLPAQALFTPGTTNATAQHTAASGETQSLAVGDTDAGSADRDSFTVSEAAALPAHTDSSSFTNDPNGTIQWPFLTGVPISSGFGARNVEGCSFCSTFHQGVDFAPGEGTPIRAIAAGTVIKVQADDGGFGNDVWIQHDVDGKQFVSVYGHMEDNSFKVVKGQQIAVGTEVGLVGSTGNSTGPHLHLEIHVNDVPVDPLAWLRANAN